MTFKEWELQAEYIPLNKYTSSGNEIQVCSLIFPYNVKVYERTIFPWNFLKEPVTHWTIDLILPESFIDKIKEFNGELNDCYYTDKGFGMAEFNNLNDAFNFNEWYKNDLIKRTT